MKTEFTMTFDTGNAAFDDGNGAEEVARILRHVAQRVTEGIAYGWVSDINGNKIGNWSLELPAATSDEEEE